MSELFFILTTVTNIAASVWLLWLMIVDEDTRGLGWLYRLGFVTGAIGLAAQAARNIQFIFTGHSPSDSELPLWYLKDLGYTMIALSAIKDGSIPAIFRKK